MVYKVVFCDNVGWGYALPPVEGEFKTRDDAHSALREAGYTPSPRGEYDEDDDDEWDNEMNWQFQFADVKVTSPRPVCDSCGRELPGEDQ